MQALHDYFERHEEQAFITKAFLTIFLIILVKTYLSGLLMLLFILFPFIFLACIRLKAASEGVSTFELLKQNITFIPIMYTEGDRKKEVIPWATYCIILLNILIFYLYEAAPWGDPKFIEKNLLFLPTDPNAWNVVVSAFSAMFLHANGGHLWGNMVFLWVLGTTVERRIGHDRFALLYIITGLFGGVAFVLSWFLATGSAGHSLGASGAIAGIMGIFAVRCYFKSMIFPLPILGIFSLILPISLKVRLNSMVIIGLFFLSDLSGGIGQLTGHSASMVGHWAHLGGMISGIILAGFLKLGEGAVEERHLEIGVKAAGAKVGFGEGERSLRQVLERNADNLEAMLMLARIKSKYAASDEGGELYRKVIPRLAGSNPRGAAQAYHEYRRRYQQPLESAAMMALAGIFQRQGDQDTAARCLDAVIAAPDAAPEVRGKALAQCASLLEKMGLEDAAESYYERLIEEFPHAEVTQRAYLRLGREIPALPAMQPSSAADSQLREAPAVVKTSQTCPACSSAMNKRRANNGVHAGKWFWVCATYPQCKGVVPAGEA
jgi:membrane associated rhomboid family serine protease